MLTIINVITSTVSNTDIIIPVKWNIFLGWQTLKFQEIFQTAAMLQISILKLPVKIIFISFRFIEFEMGKWFHLK